VAIKVVASPAEHEMITTSPEEIAKQKAREEAGQKEDSTDPYSENPRPKKQVPSFDE